MACLANQIMCLHSHLFLVPRPHLLIWLAVSGTGDEPDSSSCQALSVKRDRYFIFDVLGVPFHPTNTIYGRLSFHVLGVIWNSFKSLADPNFLNSLCSPLFRIVWRQEPSDGLLVTYILTNLHQETHSLLSTCNASHRVDKTIVRSPASIDTTAHTDTKSKKRSTPIKTVKLLILVNVFKSTKERKYFRINIIINVREDSDRVKMNLKLCRNQSIDVYCF